MKYKKIHTTLDCSLTAAKGDIVLDLLEELGQIDVGKIRNSLECENLLRFVIDSIGAAQELFFSDTDADIQNAYDRARLTHAYVMSTMAKDDAINAIARTNCKINSKDHGSDAAS